MLDPDRMAKRDAEMFEYIRRREDRRDEEARTYRPMSFWQRLVERFGGTSVQYPVLCGLCGTPTRGNRFTGYRMGCEH